MADKLFEITSADLSLGDIQTFLASSAKVRLSKDIIKKVNESNRVISEIIESEKVVYGVNTGFGKFADISIPDGMIVAPGSPGTAGQGSTV